MSDDNFLRVGLLSARKSWILHKAALFLLTAVKGRALLRCSHCAPPAGRTERGSVARQNCGIIPLADCWLAWQISFSEQSRCWSAGFGRGARPAQSNQCPSLPPGGRDRGAGRAVGGARAAACGGPAGVPGCCCCCWPRTTNVTKQVVPAGWCDWAGLPWCDSPAGPPARHTAQYNHLFYTPI